MVASASLSLAGSVPIARTRLIGRETESAVARALLLDESVPLLTLTGPGGVGKTRLALAIAGDVAANFADGVRWLDLAPLADPALVASSVAATLGVTPQPDRSVTDAIVGFLRSAQVLLLLDNCEHVLAAVGDLVAALLAGCPAVQALATSRAAIHVRGEQMLPIQPLGTPRRGAALHDVRAAPAVDLFVQRARAVDPRFALTDQNAGDVAEVCRRLDGLPLAIELAAARANVLSPAALLALLSQRLQVLGVGPRDAPARHQTLQHAIAWSYELLTPEEQALFRRLAVFAGGWTLDAAAAVGGLALPDALARLQGLVDQSLVVSPADSEASSPRFAMLETIREFGLEQVVARGEEAETRERHAAYFLALAEAAGPHLDGLLGDQARWITRMETEWDNVRAAIAWFLSRGDGASVLRLLYGIRQYLFARPFDVEVRQLLDTALRRAADAPSLVRAAGLRHLSSCAARVGDLDAALAAAEEALAIAQTQDDLVALGFGHYAVGQAWLWNNNWAPSAAAHARAVAHFRQTDRIDLLALALAELGSALLWSGQAHDAVAPLDEALALYRTIDDPRSHAIALMIGAELATAHSEHARAVRFFAEGVALAQAIGDERIVRGILAGLADVALATGQPERAAHLLGAVVAAHARGVARFGNEQQIVCATAAARGALGEAAFMAAWEAGQSVSWADAIADALAVLERGRVAPPERRRDQPSAAFALTRREREVLAFLCRRLTDAEIAERLFISPRTVMTHVSRIIDKLGAANRRDAAAIAARHGWV